MGFFVTDATEIKKHVSAHPLGLRLESVFAKHCHVHTREDET